MADDRQIAYNVRVHDSLFHHYEDLHDEIFNPIEQARLHRTLERATRWVTTGSEPLAALDYGCGTGNVTRHLVELGLRVTAADVAGNFLKLVEERYGHTGRVTALKVNGQDLSDIDDGSFDLVATYSVLHHVPDYLGILGEMARVTRPGGVLYIDHEHNDLYWERPEAYKQFLRLAQPRPSPEAQKPKRLARYLNPANYLRACRLLCRSLHRRLRRGLHLPYLREGDVHVRHDDHVEWDRIEDVLAGHDFEVLLREDFLLYIAGYREDVYQAHRDTCSDMRVLVARKR